MKEIQFNTIQAFNDFHGFEIQETGLRNSKKYIHDIPKHWIIHCISDTDNEYHGTTKINNCNAH